MTPELKKICEQIEAQADVADRWPTGPARLRPSKSAKNNCGKTASVMRVEKMLEGNDGVELVFERDGNVMRLFRAPDGWKCADRWGNTVEAFGSFPDALSAFEATQDVSNGREIQGASRGINQKGDTANDS